MAIETHLDEIIDYKKIIINKIGLSKDVVALLTDNPLIDMDSDAAYDVFDKNLYDYNYVDDTQTADTSLVMVDVEVPSVPTGTIKDLYVFVQVVVPKAQMKLDATKFKGVKGNRKDNLLRQIDLLLNNSQEFGIGKLKLESVNVASVPDKYTSTLLTYSISDFARNRKVGNQ